MMQSNKGSLKVAPLGGMPGTITPILLLSLLLLLHLPPQADAGSVGESWRYIFPFFPQELDILVGHLRTTVTRLEKVLEQCEDMIEGEYEGEENPIGVQELSADKDGDGEEEDTTMEEKVDEILELREDISKLEEKIEECRFRFWTGAEDE